MNLPVPGLSSHSPSIELEFTIGNNTCVSSLVVKFKGTEDLGEGTDTLVTVEFKLDFNEGVMMDACVRLVFSL